MKKETTTEGLIDHLNEAFTEDSTTMDISFTEDPNVPALKIQQSNVHGDDYVLVTTDKGFLPYYSDESLDFETPDTYLVCWYNDDSDLVIDQDREDRNCNRSFIGTTVTGMENIAQEIRNHFLAGWLLNQVEEIKQEAI